MTNYTVWECDRCKKKVERRPSVPFGWRTATVRNSEEEDIDYLWCDTCWREIAQVKS